MTLINLFPLFIQIGAVAWIVLFNRDFCRICHGKTTCSLRRAVGKGRPGDSGHPRLSLVAKTVDVSGQHMDLLRAELILERRHFALATLVQGFHNGAFAAAVEPGVIGEVGCPQHLIALAVGAVGLPCCFRRDEKLQAVADGARRRNP